MNTEHPEEFADLYVLSTEIVAAIINSVEEGNKEQLIRLIEPLHEADIADLLEQIDPVERKNLITLWGKDFDIDVLSELEEKILDEVVNLLPPEQLAMSVGELESDDIVDIVEDLGDKQQSVLLDALDRSDLADVQMSLQFPDESAGRIMQRRCVTSPEHWNVGQAIDALRKHDNLPDEFYHIILVNPKFVPVGQVSLGKLMASRREIPLKLLTDEDFRTIPVYLDQQDVAYAFNQYHLISAPVINENSRLVGVITIDDAMTVLDEEAEEDILRLAGVGDESLTDRVSGITWQRFPWLIVNLFTAILASIVISQFSDTIETLVALAVLMPIVASMGGNAGTQSLTVAVRALATKDLTHSNVWRVIRRESMVGLLNGIIFAVIVGSIGIIWFGTPILGAILAGAMIINMLAAGLSGILVPVCLEKMRIDPAIASSVFVTTVTDIVGFFAFLGIATAVLL